jgi:hypothetical protein
MPSPFPGMDPFIEGQEWEDFHAHFIEDLHAALVPQVRPRYVVRVERRVYLEHTPVEPVAEPREWIRPDVSVLDHTRSASTEGSVATVAEVAAPAARLALPIPERRQERYLTIRLREGHELVTSIELLSPGNKRRGSDGRREYLEKRQEVLVSPAHLVELDLLRGGARLPTLEQPPAADYYAFVARSESRPLADVYAWSVRDPLPTIPVPLAGDDPDAKLDLQSIFVAMYDRVGYDYSLDYGVPVEPALGDADDVWVRERLAGRPSPTEGA